MQAYGQTDTTRHNSGAVKTNEDRQEKKLNPDPSKSDTARTQKPTSPGKKKEPKASGSAGSSAIKGKDMEKMMLTDNLIIY